MEENKDAKEPIVLPVEKSKGGRPTKYKPEYCQKMIDFFDRPLYETISLGKDERVVPTRFPTFERFAYNIGVNADTLKSWASKFPEFLGSYEICKNMQKDYLIYHGLTGGYNSNFAKFVSLNLTDMVEKVTHEAVDNKKNKIQLVYKLKDE